MGRAALFDMDKTLIRVNTARLFTRYRRDRREVGWRESLRVAWWLLQYSVGQLDAAVVAREVLKNYRNSLEEDLASTCEAWFPEYVTPHISQAARDTVEHHRSLGDELIIATSATIYGTRPLLEELSMGDIVCTELEVQNGRFTGDVVEPLCYGEGKLKKVSAYLESRNLKLEEATFYSDSITDVPLLEAVARPVAVNPDMRLAREAKKRGWEIQRWG